MSRRHSRRLPWAPSDEEWTPRVVTIVCTGRGTHERIPLQPLRSKASSVEVDVPDLGYAEVVEHEVESVSTVDGRRIMESRVCPQCGENASFSPATAKKVLDKLWPLVTEIELSHLCAILSSRRK